MIKKANDQLQKQLLESLDGEKKKEHEKVKAMQEENQKLRKEKEALE